MPAKLLIADDHALVREGMRAMLSREQDLEVIAEAADGQEAFELCCLHRPDLVLMDIRMPKMNGLEATRAVKEQCPTVSVLMVTTHEDPDYLLDAIRAGAAGYVLKDTTKHELVEAVRKVLSGESPLDQELAMRLLKRVANQADQRTETLAQSPKSQASPPNPLTEQLTTQELRTLRLLALGKTNRQIAQDLLVSLSTVKTYVQRISNKLGVSDRTQAAVRAVELGLLGEQEEKE